MTAVTDTPVEQRLLKGAAVLGRLWKENNRCASGWKFSCACPDDTKAAFCKAKKQWLALFIDAGRELGDPNHEFEMIVSMTSAELNATGLTLTMEVEEIGSVKVGPGGDVAWSDFCRMNGEMVPTVLKVLKAFPGSRIV